ncbi:MAG TPA: 3-oxoacyl-ACP reductase family protein [Anaerolineales bacterium]|nr:3-oxoacyl-ACP reductase family protein [Anaerolineales bacterium]
MDIPPVKTLLDFSNTVAVVTGSGSGLGQSLARRFAEAGANVVVHYRSSAEGARAVVKHIAGLGGQAIAVQGDLAREADAARLVRQTVEAFGRVDVLINNAGLYPRASVLEMTLAQWDKGVDANLRSVFLCTQAAARQMIAQGGGGAIVNITSIEAENPAPDHSHYDAAKGGVLMYTRASAYELAAHGIRVNAVAPGLIWREGIEQAWPEGVARWQKTAPLRRLGLPEDVADACLFLASPASRWITGASLTVDGGVLTHQIY